MDRRLRNSWPIVVAGYVCLAVAACTTQSPQEAEIRLVRTASNAAIAAHDTASMGATLTEDYHVITSRNAESVGRSAMLKRFASDAPDVVYIRTPDVIQVFPEWNMASETGTWLGKWSDKGNPIELSGTYYAKWHQVNGKWLIRAEIFTPLACKGGPYCEQGPLK